MKSTWGIRIAVAAAAAAWLAAGGVAFADRLVLSGTTFTRDSTIYVERPDDNAGGSPTLYAGHTAGDDNGGIPSQYRRLLVHFDLGSIPADATITGAELRMMMTQSPSPAAPNDHHLHRLLASWAEGTSAATGQGGIAQTGAVSWNSREHDTLAWTTPGGDFVEDASASAPALFLTDSNPIPMVFDGQGVIDDVQAWVSGAAENDGWILIGDELTSRTARVYASSENSNPTVRPRLTVDYTFEAELSPVADTTIWDDAPDDNGGGGEQLFAGRTRVGGLRRSLLRFDLTSLPTDVYVTSAELTMGIVAVPQFGVDNEHTLHRLEASWVEGAGTASGSGGAVESGAATWNSREHGALSWTTPGGDFDPAASAAASVGTITGTIVFGAPGMASDVQRWLGDPSSNNGWILLGDESLDSGVRSYTASENAATSEPLLRVRYGAVPNLLKLD